LLQQDEPKLATIWKIFSGHEKADIPSCEIAKHANHEKRTSPFDDARFC